MQLIEIYCQKCGEKLSVNAELKKGVCNYCGHPFVLDNSLVPENALKGSKEIPSGAKKKRNIIIEIILTAVGIFVMSFLIGAFANILKSGNKEKPGVDIWKETQLIDDFGDEQESDAIIMVSQIDNGRVFVFENGDNRKMVFSSEDTVVSHLGYDGGTLQIKADSGQEQQYPLIYDSSYKRYFLTDSVGYDAMINYLQSGKDIRCILTSNLLDSRKISFTIQSGNFPELYGELSKRSISTQKTEDNTTDSKHETDSEPTKNDNEGAEEKNDSSNVIEIPNVLKGTWETASMGYEFYGTMQPEYYVQFDDGSINYGHMKDDQFVLDHSDKIHSIEEIKAGEYRIQAESSNGDQYTYQTCEEDTDTLEYYYTWDENEFMDKYSGSASLSRSSEGENISEAAPGIEGDELFYEPVYERLLTEDDLFEIAKLETGKYPDNRSIFQMIINEIYARHGLIHGKEEVRKYFEQKSWYKGKTESAEEIVEELSQIEKDNVIVLRNKDTGNPDIYDGISNTPWEGFFGDKELMDELAIVKCIDGTYNVDYSVFRTGSFLGKPKKIEGNTMLVESDSYGAKVEYLIDFSDMYNIKVTVTNDGSGLLGNYESTGMYRHADSYYDYLKSLGWSDHDIELTQGDFFKGTAYER